MIKNLKQQFLWLFCTLLTTFSTLLLAQTQEQVTKSFTITRNATIQLHDKFILDKARVSPQGLEYVSDDGYRILFSINPAVQNTIAKTLARYNVDVGAYVAIEPKTGRVLALVGHRTISALSQDPVYLRASYPAASLFKIITAAAALENSTLSPQQKISIPGSCQHFYRQAWLSNPRRDRRRVRVDHAFANSCNVVFGRLALYWAGYDALKRTARNFQFNQSPQFALPLEPSYAHFPEQKNLSAKRLSQIGAGFGKVFISPIHAAMISAAVANNGIMMHATLVDHIETLDGKRIYTRVSRRLARVVTPNTANILRAYMKQTVRLGTSRSAFRRRGYPRVKTTAGGKTGTLTGYAPFGKNFWFSGIAPVENPEVSVSALIIAQKRYSIKGAMLARIGIAAHFNKRQQRRFWNRQPQLATNTKSSNNRSTIIQ